MILCRKDLHPPGLCEDRPRVQRQNQNNLQDTRHQVNI